MTMPLSRRTLGVAALSSAAALLTSCTGGAIKPNEDGSFPITLASQDNPTGFSTFLANELGYYEDAGLAVNIQYAANGAALLASGSAGDWQGGWQGSPPLLTGYDTWGLLPTGTMLTENKNIILFMNQKVLEGSTPAQALAENRVGVVSNSVSAQLLYACAKELGVSSSEVEIVPLDPPAIVNAMLDGEIQAGVTFSAVNWPLVKDPDTYVQVCNGDDANVLLSDPFVVTPTFWNENPEEAAVFLEASYRANEYILETPVEEVLPYMMDYLDSIGAEYPEEAAKYSMEARTYFSLDDALEEMRSGELAEGLEATAKFLVDAGVYDAIPDIEAMSDQGLEVLEAAASLRD